MKKLVGLKFWSAWFENCLTVMILSLISASCLVVSTSEVPSNADKELVFYLYYVYCYVYTRRTYESRFGGTKRPRKT